MKNRKRILTALIFTTLCSGSLTALAADLPSYFDWRLSTPTDKTSAATTAIVSAIRNQNPYGDCWAFATIASLESSANLKRQAAGLGPVNRLSERYLAWMAYAKPLDGSGDGFYYQNTDPTALDRKGTLAVYENGDSSYQPVTVLVRQGITYNDNCPYVTSYTDKSMKGVQSLSGNGVALHDCYGLPFDDSTNTAPGSNTVNANITYYKTMLKTYGVIRINYDAEGDGKTPETDMNICASNYHSPDHAVSLVGWNDNYTMTVNGVTHTGAWIMRNNWGTEMNGKKIGDNGYYYMSYDDPTITFAMQYNAETDWGRYTAVDTVAPGAWHNNVNATVETSAPGFVGTGGYKTANKLTSNGSQFLKAVGIFVPADSMSYQIDVSLKGDTPANATTIYSQSGTFGQDGTPMYKGYRTVDFTKYVYLPNANDYIITVTLKGTDGTAYCIPISYEDGKTLTAGTSFVYDAATSTWKDVQDNDDPTTKYLGLPLFALNKYSNEANGGDFTVVSLNDNGAGGSGIYLGKKDELYTTDLLHPTGRYTLSNMTVELTKGLTDSVYGGVISGEGTVTKTGDGMLALSGGNTYTGATSVNAGSLALTGSLKSPVTVASGATLTGTGTINGNLTNSGTLAPGLNSDARTLMGNANPMGTLTVNGNLTSTGALQIAVNGTDNSALKVTGASGIVGTSLSLMDGYNQPLVNHHYTYLSSDSGITGNASTTAVSPYISLNSAIEGNNGILTATQTQTLGNLPSMTPSENSVGAALNKALLNHIANNPNDPSTAAMNSLLYQNAADSQASMKQITTVTRAQLIAVSPLTAMTTGATYNRLDTALYEGNINVDVPTASFDGVPATMKVSTPMALDTTNNLWFKLLRGYESYGGTGGGYDLDNKSFGGVIGYDRAVNGTTRVGGLLSYAKTDYTTDIMSGDSHDWRIGIYASHDTGTWKTQGLMSYGQNKYDFNRYIAYDNSKLSSNYTAKVFDMDLKVKYLPQYNRAKSWQVAPYVGLAYTHSTQGSYTEDGSSVFAQNIDSASNNSYRAEVGVEWKHDMTKDSSFGGSVGYKRVLSGVNPELNGTFVSDDNQFTLKTDNDRNYFTYSLNLKKNTGHNWTMQGDVRGEKSAHNHSEVYSLMAKYAF